ncbi:MAG TPA: YciI family protein [Candidatus Binatia bacterium]
MWYIVLSRSLPGKDKEKEQSVEAHRKWLDDQHRAGRLLFSGPTTDSLYGIYVMLAENKNAAERLAATDPHHANGARKFEALEWRAHRSFRLDGPSIEDVERMARGK